MKKISVLAAIIFLFTIGTAWAQEVKPGIPDWALKDEWTPEEGPAEPAIPGEMPAVQNDAEAGAAARGDGGQAAPEPSQAAQRQQ